MNAPRIIQDPTPPDLDRLADLWEAAVRATHHFLSEDDIRALRPEVRNAYLPGVPELYVARATGGAPLGFSGLTPPDTADGWASLDMLFIDPAHHGRGVGMALVRHALARYARLDVDVNERNPGGLAFYQKCGFVERGRSELDGQGRPFPIIHLRRPAPDPGDCPPIVRLAEAGDVHRLVQARLDFCQECFPPQSTAEKLALADRLEAYFQAHLNRDCLAALAEDGGIIAAAAFLVLIERPASPAVPNGRLGDVGNVLTSPAYRRRGLATAVVRLLIAEGERRGLTRIDLAATPAGRPVYEALGFEADDSHTHMRLTMNERKS